MSSTFHNDKDSGQFRNTATVKFRNLMSDLGETDKNLKSSVISMTKPKLPQMDSLKSINLQYKPVF